MVCLQCDQTMQPFAPRVIQQPGYKEVIPACFECAACDVRELDFDYQPREFIDAI